MKIMIKTNKSNNVKHKKYGFLAVIALSFVMAGCASKTAKVEQYSGFLSDYTKLVKGPGVGGGEVLSWISPVLVERKYTKVMLDSVIIYPAPEPGPQIRSEMLTSMLVYLNKAVKEEVGKKYEIVTEPGKGVVRMRAAVTTIETTLEDLAFYEYVPIALALAGASSAAGIRSQAVEILVEAELTDSLSGERVAAAIRKGFGDSVGGRRHQVEVENVRPVLDGWAKSLVKVLDVSMK
jgi:hypothetical protein